MTLFSPVRKARALAHCLYITESEDEEVVGVGRRRALGGGRACRLRRGNLEIGGEKGSRRRQGVQFGRALCQRARRTEKPRKGGGVFPQGRRAGDERSSIQFGRMLPKRLGCGKRSRTGGVLVPQGRRAGRRQGADHTGGVLSQRHRRENGSRRSEKMAAQSRLAGEQGCRKSALHDGYVEFRRAGNGGRRVEALEKGVLLLIDLGKEFRRRSEKSRVRRRRKSSGRRFLLLCRNSGQAELRRSLEVVQ